jgi:hypothetical protein
MKPLKPQFPLAPLSLLTAGLLLYLIKATVPYLIFQPLSFPIDLTKPTFQTPTFQVPAARGHALVLEVDRLGSIPHQECLLGQPISAEKCKNQPSKVNLSWIIYSGDNKIAEGKSQEGGGGGWSQKTLSRNIGRIPTLENIGKASSLESNKNYVLKIVSHADASELGPAHPRIKIDTYGQAGFHEYATFAWIIFLAAPIMLIAGIFWLSTWVVINIFLSRKQH